MQKMVGFPMAIGLEHEKFQQRIESKYLLNKQKKL